MSAYGHEYFDARRDEEDRRQRMRRQEVERLVARTGLTGGVAVDIGCGTGELLELLPADRWQRYGAEVSEYGREVSGSKGILFDLPDGGGWCDLVVFRGSLQHLDRPLEALFDAYRWLKPGGWLVALATPNAGSAVYRLFQDLPALDPPRNFVVFSDRILGQCLRNIGFTQIDFVYPYLGTPYASLLRDHARFIARFAGVKRPFAFWRNMMECYARK